MRPEPKPAVSSNQRGEKRLTRPPAKASSNGMIWLEKRKYRLMHPTARGASTGSRGKLWGERYGSGGRKTTKAGKDGDSIG